MTKDKRAVYVGGAVLVIALLLFLFMRGGRIAGLLGGSSAADLPALDLTGLPGISYGGGAPIIIPGLNFGERDISMIGACCADCTPGGGSSGGQNPYYSGTTFVWNAAANGPNIYNYSTTNTTSKSSEPPCVSWGFSGGRQICTQYASNWGGFVGVR